MCSTLRAGTEPVVPSSRMPACLAMLDNEFGTIAINTKAQRCKCAADLHDFGVLQRDARLVFCARRQHVRIVYLQHQIPDGRIFADLEADVLRQLQSFGIARPCVNDLRRFALAARTRRRFRIVLRCGHFAAIVDGLIGAGLFAAVDQYVMGGAHVGVGLETNCALFKHKQTMIGVESTHDIIADNYARATETHTDIIRSGRVNFDRCAQVRFGLEYSETHSRFDYHMRTATRHFYNMKELCFMELTRRGIASGIVSANLLTDVVDNDVTDNVCRQNTTNVVRTPLNRIIPIVDVTIWWLELRSGIWFSDR